MTSLTCRAALLACALVAAAPGRADATCPPGSPAVGVVSVLPPTIAVVGEPATVTVTVKNTGAAAFSALPIGLYISNDSAISQFDRRVGEALTPTLAPGNTVSLEITAAVPANLAPRAYYFGVVADPSNTLCEDTGDLLDNVRGAGTSTAIQAPAADFAAIELVWPPRAAAGEVVPVQLVLGNRGVLDATADVDFFISTNDSIGPRDPHVGSTRVEVAAGSDTTQLAWVRLPPGLAPSQYYIAAWANPEGQVTELRSDNNQVLSLPAIVTGASLTIETTWLPDALVGMPYARSLVANGADGPVAWSLAGGTLPEGLTLSADGAISGTTEEVGTFVPVFRVTSGTRTADALLVLRTYTPTTPLGVATTALPPAVAGSDYAVPLAPAGGTPPFAWKLVGGVIAPGLSLTDAGVITGRPSVGQTTAAFTVEVRDLSGTAARRDLRLRILGRGELAIRNPVPDTARVGESFLWRFEPAGVTGDLRWRLDGGTLPPGLALATDDLAATLAGTPTVAGLYSFGLRVEHATGQVDRRTILVAVTERAIGVLTSELPPAIQGHDYQAVLAADVSGVTWRLAQGELPEGLQFSADGLLTGTVGADARPGARGLVFEATDGSGGVGRAVLGLRVVEVPVEFGGGGCSQPGAGAALLLGLLAWRRRRSASLVASLVAVLLPAAAHAQAQEYFPVMFDEPVFPTLLDVRERIPVALESGGSSFSCPRDDCTVAVTLPFDFPYFGQTYRVARVSTNGLVMLGPGSSASYASPDPMPDPDAPNAVLAPWWDDLFLPSTPTNPEQALPNDSWVFVATLGAEPTRTFVFEWHRFTSYGGPSAKRLHNMQLRLGEDGSISFHYEVPPANSPTGTPYLDAAFDAVAGVESPDGTEAVDVLPCTPNCSASDWPGGKKIVLTRSIELVAGNATGPELARAETPARYTIRFANRGSFPATGVASRLLLSTDTVLDTGDLVLATGAPVDLRRGEEVVLDFDDVVIPAGTVPGPYYLLVQVDPDDLIDESGEADNVKASGPIRLAPPAADFEPVALTLGATRASPGETVDFELRVRNAGSRPGTPHWRLVASRNDFLSLSDRTLASGVVTLNAFAEQTITSTLEIPADVASGAYSVGVLVDAPDDPLLAIPEINEFNNTRLAADAGGTQVLVIGGELAITTTALPPAARGAFYGMQLRASGGDGTVLWGLVAPTRLPSGLELRPFGALEGVPRTPGDYTFRVRVIGNGTEVVERTFTLQVTDPDVPLTLATHALPAATAGSEFEVRLTGVGGTAPYAFRVSEGELPAGLSLTLDGRLGGLPATPGVTQVTFRLTDDAGATVTRALAVTVLAPSTPLIVAATLPDARLDAPYSHTFQALGGRSGLVWSLEATRRYVADAANPFEALPLLPGLALSTDGVLSGAPREAGTYAIDVRVTDAAGSLDEETFLLFVDAAQGIAIVTTELPEAIVGEPYAARLHTTGDASTHAYSLADDGQRLPPGLALALDGGITGAPEQVGTFGFLVRVMDQSGRGDVRALAITVLPEEVASEGCAGGPPTWPLLGLLLLLRRRTRRASSGLVALTFALALPSACTPRVFDPCENVSCQAGEQCDPADGSCVCGEVGVGRTCSDREFCEPSTSECVLLDRCDLVSCRNGQSCDPADGLCKCGAAPCASGERCEGTPLRCVLADLCAGVTCIEGESCDPGTGTCLCGGERCEVGESCVAGRCEASPCASLACTGGSVCDPATSTCRCGNSGGDECFYGQTCLPDEGRCLLSSRCSAVRCSGGSSCDPADGRCRCGGPTGPECGAGQTCDLSTKRCVGGDLCFGRTCPSGSECNREDGDCHCGGQDGPVCGNGTVCLVSGGTSSCRNVCDPVTQTPCASTLACTYNVSTRLASCAAAGARGEGASCTASSECARGMHCVAAGFSGTGVCRVYCARPGGSCPVAGRTCKGFSSAPADLGACQP